MGLTNRIISEIVDHPHQGEQLCKDKGPFADGCQDVPKIPTVRGCLSVMSNSGNRELG